MTREMLIDICEKARSAAFCLTDASLRFKILETMADMLENNRAFMKFIYNYAESNNNDVGAVLLVITIFNLLFIGLTAVLATICNYICKKKVNLE